MNKSTIPSTLQRDNDEWVQVRTSFNLASSLESVTTACFQDYSGKILHAFDVEMRHIYIYIYHSISLFLLIIFIEYSLDAFQGAYHYLIAKCTVLILYQISGVTGLYTTHERDFIRSMRCASLTSWEIQVSNTQCSWSRSSALALLFPQTKTASRIVLGNARGK